MFVVLTGFSQNSKQYLVILFMDKPNYHADSISSYISTKALEKRYFYHTDMAKVEDCPVYQPYIDTILALDTQINLITTSKWFNYAVISATADVIPLIEKQKFVYQVDSLKNIDVAYLLTNDDLYPPTTKTFKPIDTIVYPTLLLDSAYYGLMYHQIAMFSGQYLHNADYQGQNMNIAVIDADFGGVDTLDLSKEWYRNHVKYSYDYIKESSCWGDHGLNVLSIMAANQPYNRVGTAPYADYVLIRTEAICFENRIEQFFMVRAMEICDSLGVDVVNLSLGHTTFDDNLESYHYEDLDGLHSVASIAASRLARKNTIVVIAAGNLGDKPWKYISTPADGKDVLSIAAVDRDSIVTSFSSRGSLNFSIIKPSVAALGEGCTCIDYRGYVNENVAGTSFATPLISGMAACLWQAFPNYTAQDIMQAIIQSASHYGRADTLIGNGIPNFWKAYLLLQQDNLAIMPIEENTYFIYPTITNDVIKINVLEKSNIKIFNQLGSEIYNNTLNVGLHTLSLKNKASGLYFITITDELGKTYYKKIVKQ